VEAACEISLVLMVILAIFSKPILFMGEPESLVVFAKSQFYKSNRDSVRPSIA
jgi:hypothetical protein